MVPKWFLEFHIVHMPEGLPWHMVLGNSYVVFSLLKQMPTLKSALQQNEAKKLGIEEWPTKACQLSLEGIATNFDDAQTMVWTC